MVIKMLLCDVVRHWKVEKKLSHQVICSAGNQPTKVFQLLMVSPGKEMDDL